MKPTAPKTLLLRATSLMLAVAAACASTSGNARAQRVSEVIKKVGFDQKLDNQVPLDLAFLDETGAPVRLDTYLKKGAQKPAILVFVYFQCPMLCTQVLNELVRALRPLGLTPGEDFEILTVSIDPRETPELAARKKQSYLESLGRPADGKGWHFLTGDEASIKKLADSAGFRFMWDEDTQQFAHPGGLVLLTPEGRVSRYFFDVLFPSHDLRLGLVEASHGKIGSLTDRVLLLCFHYDPTTGKYGLIVTNVIRALCLLMVAAVGTFVFVMLRKEARLAARATATT